VVSTERFVEVVATVRAWPVDQRLALVQEIVESLRTLPRAARPRTLDRAVGLLRRPGPAPTDEECARIIEEERLAKHTP
jgi:hypothetical protein